MIVLTHTKHPARWFPHIGVGLTTHEYGVDFYIALEPLFDLRLEWITSKKYCVYTGPHIALNVLASTHEFELDRVEDNDG